jgi:hypothetical protein
MAWYIWLWIAVAIPFFLWSYNTSVEEAREKALYFGSKPSRTGHLAVVYTLCPLIAAFVAALWPIEVVVLVSAATVKVVRSPKKASDD